MRTDQKDARPRALPPKPQPLQRQRSPESIDFWHLTPFGIRTPPLWTRLSNAGDHLLHMTYGRFGQNAVAEIEDEGLVGK